MKLQTTYTVRFRRKRTGKTDYKQRLKLLLVKKPRIAVRKSLKNILMQVIEYRPNGDCVLVSAHTRELEKIGWKANKVNLPTGYLCGYLLGKKAIARKIKKCIFDIGMYTSVKGCVLYAALKGLVDAGLDIPHSKEIFPPESRIKGEHIAAWAKKLKADSEEKFKKVFSKYLKQSFDPEKMPSHFEEIKNKIEGMK